VVPAQHSVSFGVMRIGAALITALPLASSLYLRNPSVLRHVAMASSKTALDETDAKGAFVRTDAGFRNWIAPDSRFPPEAGRYHLYISYACPWAHRCLMTLRMKGLEDAIGLSIVHPTWQRSRPDTPDDHHHGWIFKAPDDAPLSQSEGHGSFDCSDCIPDTVNGFQFVRDLYEKANDKTGKYSVPVLWDKQEGTIVSNESSEIIQMLNSAFNQFAKNPELDLFPEALASAMDEVNSWVYPTINNGVYRCGFAKTQGAYDEAVTQLYESLDRMEEVLSKNRYLCGDALTAADIRAFVTLVRFDEVYVVYFKCNKKRIADYPNIHNYVREIYQMPAVADTVNMRHIKTHYFTSHPTLNYYAVIPAGPSVIEDLKMPHNRGLVGKA